jgi:hypothetical protein
LGIYQSFAQNQLFRVYMETKPKGGWGTVGQAKASLLMPTPTSALGKTLFGVNKKPLRRVAGR